MKPRHDYPPGDEGYREFLADLMKVPPLEQQEALDATTAAEEARHHVVLGEVMCAQRDLSAGRPQPQPPADDPLTAVHQALVVAEAATMEAARSVLGSTATGTPVLTPIRLTVWRDLLATLESCRGAARRASADALQRTWRWDEARKDWDHGNNP